MILKIPDFSSKFPKILDFSFFYLSGCFWVTFGLFLLISGSFRVTFGRPWAPLGRSWAPLCRSRAPLDHQKFKKKCRFRFLPGIPRIFRKFTDFPENPQKIPEFRAFSHENPVSGPSKTYQNLRFLVDFQGSRFLDEVPEIS